MDDNEAIALALEEAKSAAALRGEVPVGAVLLGADRPRLLARDGNRILELEAIPLPMPKCW